MSGGNEYAALDSPSFTEVFVEHLVELVKTIPSHHAGGTAAEGIHEVVRSRLGVSRQSTRNAIDCLTTMRVITEVEGILGRSRAGDTLRRAIRQDGSGPLAIAVLRSGMMADQIRTFRGVLTPHADGYHCGRSEGQSAAPQLVGLLARLPDVRTNGRIEIGRISALELDSIWNELPPASRIDWADREKRRKAIGDRAEIYSLQLERSSHIGALQNIAWVSRDDDSLGYDIEVRGAPTRQIEVKGTQGRDVQFFLSANEYRIAKRYGSTYEIQFWGTIDLQSDPADEFQRLKDAGYPIRVQDPADALTKRPWNLEPSQYKVTRQGE